jgi:membrane associated rhomboid family serine protease
VTMQLGDEDDDQPGQLFARRPPEQLTYAQWPLAAASHTHVHGGHERPRAPTVAAPRPPHASGPPPVRWPPPPPSESLPVRYDASGLALALTEGERRGRDPAQQRQLSPAMLVKAGPASIPLVPLRQRDERELEPLIHVAQPVIGPSAIPVPPFAKLQPQPQPPSVPPRRPVLPRQVALPMLPQPPPLPVVRHMAPHSPSRPGPRPRHRNRPAYQRLWPRLVAASRQVLTSLMRCQPPAWYSQPYPPILTTFVILSCITLFIWEASLASWHFESMLINPLWGPSRAVMVLAGAKDTSLILYSGQGWRLLTSFWVHAGVIDLCVNMVGMLRFAWELENAFGVHILLPLYLICGTFATLTSCLFLPATGSAGASGAIFGLVGMAWADLIQNGKQMEKRPRCRYVLWLTGITVLALLAGLLPYVDNMAHIGGLVMGVCIGLPFLIQRSQLHAEGAARKPISCRKYAAAIIGAVLASFLLIGGLIVLHTIITPTSTWCRACLVVDCAPSPWWSC